MIGREFSHALLAAVAAKTEAELQTALDRLIAAGLLFRQGVPPHATYLFKHALVQDAAYGTLLREPRRALHTRIAETLESQFADIAENQLEILARHFTEAGLIERAANLWGKAGLRSLERSALAEGIEQLTRALAQIATLPATPSLRREEIQLQVALITPLFHVKGYSAPETKAASEHAGLLIEQAQALGEPPDDPLLLFLVLYGFWTAQFVAFNVDARRDLGTRFLTLAEKQGAPVPRVIGHRIIGPSLTVEGCFTEARTHYEHALALYDPIEHRLLAGRFGQDASVSTLSLRALNQWLLGYPAAALGDVDQSLRNARQIGQAASLMFALFFGTRLHILCGNYSVATALAEELVLLATERGASHWKAFGLVTAGYLSRPSEAVQRITSGLSTYRGMGGKLFAPLYLSDLASAYVGVGHFDDAWRCIGEAITAVETTQERWCEAEVHRTAGEIALLSPERDAAKAEACFRRALAVARQQQAKSWELRAAMSLARLWRDQGKVQQARELLAPVYGWFTEGFDTRDLKEAKALLEELA
jgi:predicted ATPase